jgi:hypothetical protein
VVVVSKNKDAGDSEVRLLIKDVAFSFNQKRKPLAQPCPQPCDAATKTDFIEAFSDFSCFLSLYQVFLYFCGFRRMAQINEVKLVLS